MTITRLLTLVVLIAAAAVAAPSPASAAKPCWVKLVNDWYDGRIDGTYPAKCYRDAIKNIPDDLKGYSDAEEDIRRALLNATREKGGEIAPSEPIAPEPNTKPKDVEPLPGEEEAGEEEDEEVAAPGSGDDDGGGGILGVLKPSNADSVPIPLLVLAGLALILLAAAAASFAARRIQARRHPLPRGPENP